MEKTIDAVQTDERKPYSKPEIVHEIDIETRAGSEILPDIINPVDN